jgi:cell division protein FtsI (penicillin-binding protein 3)
MTTIALSLEGGASTRGRMTGRRIRFAMLLLLLIFGAVGTRLVQLGLVVTDTSIEGVERSVITASRPEILDREGITMALDLRVPSLFAEPRRIVDVEEAVAKVRSILPDLDEAGLRKKLSTDKGFVWIKRELTPAQQDAIMQLGLPGFDFVSESRRFYPGGSEASHVLGAVNIDNQGISGLEKYLDDTDLAVLQEIGLARGATLTPVRLSLDVRVQHVMRQELLDALTRYQAIAAAAVMLDARTGEVIALSSLPDFDPNDPKTALLEGRLNRIAAGSFELGSTFKSVTFAAALDSGKVTLTDSFDARFGIRFGRFTIDDFKGKNRILTTPEVYKYSSNIGTIRIQQALGKEEFRAFLSRLHFDELLTTELPETARPNVPPTFSDIVAATAAFGHGISITPLRMASVMAAFVNGGIYLKPTFFPREPSEAQGLGERVIKPETSDRLRYLMRLNALEGSGSRMNKIAAGYRAGGKTGTAEKVVNGRYQANTNLNAFASAFPLDDPKYVMVVLVDEPKAENAQSGTTAGWNAGEVSGRIIQKTAPMLGIAPDFDEALDSALVPPELRTASN